MRARINKTKERRRLSQIARDVKAAGKMTAGESGPGKKGGGEPEGEREASATVGAEPQPENNQT